MRLEAVLKQYFGYETFRTGQREIIKTVLAGDNVLGILPTGSGKSICYQLPALLLPGLTIVVSPLLALMEDQVQELKSYGIKKVAAINSLTPYQIRQTILKQLHKFKIIYLSPEMLQANEVLQALTKVRVSLFVVDEAHCISQWGHEFRTDYLKLAQARTTLQLPPCLALTATATSAVQEDIVRQLQLENVKKMMFSVDRNNISIVVREVEHIDEKISTAIELVQNLQGPGLIYFSTRSWTERFANLLREQGESSVAYYHGGMDGESRLLIQQQFIHNQLQVICCTNAFGMGINKKNIRYVIHFHYPTQMESYIQEIGRAGRDGKQSLAILLYANEDAALANSLIDMELPTKQQINEVLAFLHHEYHDRQVQNEREFLYQIRLGEVGFRLIRFYLEKTGLIRENRLLRTFDISEWTEKLSNYIETRRVENREKLRSFQHWLQSNDCRRESYLAYFDESLKEKPQFCCDNCDSQILEAELLQRKTGVEETLLFAWEKELRLLFHIAPEEKELKKNE